jgi:hypothetical protein
VLLLAIVAYLFISVLWSVDPQTSFRRSVIYFLFALGVIGIANSLSGEEYLELLRKVVFLSATASLVFLMISPAALLLIRRNDPTVCYSYVRCRIINFADDNICLL